MPKALISLPDVYESVTRRVAVDVIAQLARTMRLPGDTVVYLPGNAEAVPMNGGTFGECCDPGIRYPAQSRLVVRYTEELDEAHTLVTPVNNQEHRPLFYDPVRDVTLRPVYRYVSLQVNFEYNAPSIVIAQRWLDEMRAKISMLRAELYHTLEYHYGVPQPVMGLLKHIHETAESSAVPTGLTFEEYFERYKLQPTKVVTTLINTHPITVVPEKQYEALGWFDFTTTPSQPERQDTGNYITNFTYTLHYNRPMQLFCSYPMLVHNKALDRLYRLQEAYESFKTHTRRVSTTKGAFDAFQDMLTINKIPYIHHPDTDDWSPPQPHKDQLTFFSGLLVITPADRRSLIDLYALGDFTFTPYFLEYFAQQGDVVFDHLRSVLSFRLYENNRWRNDIKLSFMPGTLTIVADRDLDLTQYYHLQISIQRNWYQVAAEALDTLRRYPVVIYLLLRALGVFLGGGHYRDLRLLGVGRLHHSGTGQGTITADPTVGGQWPWPWLSAEWGEIGYPAPTWTQGGWPGGGWESEPWPDEQGIPTWPGDVNYPHLLGGEVSRADLQQAVEQTDDLAGNYIDRRRIGPLLVLYSQILSKRRSIKES